MLTRSEEEQAEIEALAARAGAGTATAEAAPIHHDRSVMVVLMFVYKRHNIFLVILCTERWASTPACISWQRSGVTGRGVVPVCVSCGILVATGCAFEADERC